MRRLLASAASLALALGLLVGVTPSATASTNLGTVTVSYNPGPMTYSISPSSLVGSLNDTFTLANTMNDNVASFVSLVNDSGSVTLGGTSCTGDTSCRVFDNTSGVFTITGTGSVTVRRYRSGPASYQTLGTLTITASSSSGGGRENLVNRSYTATVDANGGSCTGTTSWQRIDNDFAFPGVFTLPSANNCTRPNYTLAGWALTANATAVRFAPLSPYLMGNSNVTLYAVWRPNGVEVVYDANVGLETQCIAGGTNLTTAAERRSAATVVAVGSATATAAPCSPTGLALSGWALTGDGASVAGPGAALPASITSGTSVTLYAKWSVRVQRTIVIVGDRGLESGSAGGVIFVEGTTTGFAVGDPVVPFFRSPGQTEYVAGSSRPKIDLQGGFTWKRNTGKKTFVYFTSEDGSVKSNTAFIPAS